jgi:mono/diheme cytochrome c family protein
MAANPRQTLCLPDIGERHKDHAKGGDACHPLLNWAGLALPLCAGQTWPMPKPPLLPALLCALALSAPIAAQAQPEGRALYDTYCAACHGTNLEGAPDWQRPGPDGLFPAPPHDETGHTWHHGDRFLFDYVARGGQAVLDDLGVNFTSAMPAFGDLLQEDEIAAILDFIRQSWPEDIRTIQAARSAAEDTP